VEWRAGDPLSMVEWYNVTVEFKKISDGGVHHGSGLWTGSSVGYFPQSLVGQTHQPTHRQTAAQ